jgi:hypothetical protein
MKQTMKWALPLCLLIAAIPAGAQTASVTGTTTLDYDAQTNTMIGTCIMTSSYTTQAYYTPYSICGIAVTGADTLAAVGNPSYSISGGGGSPDSTVQFTPSAGVSYTAWGFYGVLFLDVSIHYIEYDGSYEFSPVGWDPWDYSFYEQDPEDCLTDDCTWNGQWEPAVYFDAYVVAVGEVSSNPIDIELAYTKSKWNNTYSSVLGGGVQCFVSQWCTVASQPPACNPSYVIQEPTYPGQNNVSCWPYYNTNWLAWRIGGGAWNCFPLLPGQNAVGTTDSSVASCTQQ